MGKGRKPCCDKDTVKRGPWSPAEDLRLITFIQKHGHENWRALPKQAGLLRCGKSCRLRWINYLRPDVKRGNFNKEEEESIIRLHEAWGNKWSKIASQFPGRTDNEIKNVWNTHLKKKLEFKKSGFDGDDQLSKELSSIASSSSSSSSASIFSGKPSLAEELIEHQKNDQEMSTLVTKKPHEPCGFSIFQEETLQDCPNYIDLTELTSSSLSPDGSNGSSLAVISRPAVEEQMDFQFDFSEPFDFPSDSDYEFWDMIRFEPLEVQMHPEAHQDPNCGIDARWLSNLENELGLEAAPKTAPTDKDEGMLLEKEAIGTDVTAATKDATDQFVPAGTFDCDKMPNHAGCEQEMDYFQMWPSLTYHSSAI